MPRSLLIFLTLLHCLQATRVDGQETPLARVADVMQIQPFDAMGSRPRAVRISGVVLAVNASKSAFYFHDGTGGIGVQLTPQVEAPVTGQSVLIDGRVVLYRIAGFSHTRIQANSLAPAAKVNAPTATNIDVQTLNQFTHYDQWVSTEGYVMDWKFRDPTLSITLIDSVESTTATVQISNPSELPDNFIGAKVRLTGINTGDHTRTNAMLLPSLNQVEILEPGYPSVFEAPKASITEVSNRQLVPGKRHKVQGVVAATSGSDLLYLKGEAGTLLCRIAKRSTDSSPGVIYAESRTPTKWSPGDKVEVVGSQMEASESVAEGTNFSHCIVKLIAKGEPPTPDAIDIERISKLRDGDRWVVLEAVVNSWSRMGDGAQFGVNDTTGSLIVAVRNWQENGPPQNLFGARMRFTGIARTNTSEGVSAKFESPNDSFVSVIAPGAADAFDAPLATAENVKLRAVPAIGRVKVRGVIVGRVGDNLYIREGLSAIRIQLQSPPSGPPEGANDLGKGDEVEVVGTPMLGRPESEYEAYDLVNAQVKKVGHQGLVEPVEATLPDLATGAHDSDIVLTRGRLISEQQLPQADGEWRSTMTIESSGTRMLVIYGGHTHGAFDILKVDDEITVKGLVNKATSKQPQSLWVEAPGDVKSLGMSPVVRARQLWLWGGIISAAFILLAGWVLLLLRSQRIQKAAAQELKVAAEATRASELRWKLLFEQSPLSVQIFSPDGQAIRFNKAWSNLFRLSDEAGYAFNVLKDPDLNASGAVNLIRKAFEGEVVDVPPVPFPVNTDPPEVRWIGGVLYPVKNDEGRVLEVVTVHNDITETKRAEEAMQSLNQTLEKRVQERTMQLEEARAEIAKSLDHERELGELKSRFVSMVSHEFRTPLGVTMSAVEIMRHYDDRLPPEKRRELCNEIHEATRGMADLMEQVLVLGRAEAGRLAFRPKPIDFHPFIGKIIDDTLSATNRRCPIRYEFSGNFQDARGDESLLRHILGNLIGNAVKYSPANSEVEVRARREGSDLICEIRDHGIGIPEQDRANLFEAFHRCTNVGDTPGTGLGLVIVKHCIDLHGGSIDLRSVVGDGTTFSIRLPFFDLPQSTPPSNS
ncbi:MAG: PAS domain-containing sensor histidine kinase [Verrucomicrobiales bacterium]|nr:PAS domain-containing sensor histidine kinase [Verrucomicrobiales bacterium]MCP5558998.1 PAS domain-containing sensor histidine kinase [Verrucomicrobiaceae bacterium]